MKYIVYLTENLQSKINGISRIYVGVHKTKDPSIWDGYLGCGCYAHKPHTYKNPKTAFLFAVKKYGPKSFKSTVMYVYDNKYDAYAKEKYLVDKDFVNSDYTYNMIIGGVVNNEFHKTIKQFDLNGMLIKEWNDLHEIEEELGYNINKLKYCIKYKLIYMNSFWSRLDIINIMDFSIKHLNKTTYLYSKEGKLLNEFNSQIECSKYINYDNGELSRCIKYNKLIRNMYYVSNSLYDLFEPNIRKQYINQLYYVYKEDNTFIGKYYGKKLMNIINLHSWNYINHIFTHNNNWYKNFYISLNPINSVPCKKYLNGFCIDVLNKYGEYIETLQTIKDTCKKYNVSYSSLRNIQYNDKYIGEYIFKFHSK